MKVGRVDIGRFSHRPLGAKLKGKLGNGDASIRLMAGGGT